VDIKEEELRHIKLSNNQKRKLLLEFTTMMERLTSSGIHIKNALDICRRSWTEKKYNPAALLLEEIKKGKSFSQAVKAQESFFPATCIKLLEAGEMSGKLNEIFKELQAALDFKMRIRKKISSAAIYPSIVFSSVIICAVCMAAFIFPKLKDMFSQFNPESVNEINRSIGFIQTFISVFIIILILLIPFFYILKKLRKKHYSVKLKTDSLILKIPVLGKLVIFYETMNFAFIMETLCSGGISVKDSLNKAVQAGTNAAYKEEINSVHSDIIKGMQLSEAIMTKNIFPEQMKNWIASGEESGSSWSMFAKIRNYFEKELEYLLEKIMTFTEPAMTLLTGTFMIIMITAIILPVFSLYGTVL